MKRGAWIVFALALVLRLAYGLAQDHAAPYTAGSEDSAWYLANGYALVTGQDRFGYQTDVARLQAPPLYLLLIGVVQAVVSPEAAIIVIRVLQAALSAVSCALAYGLAVRLTGREAAGWVAGLALALSPAFIIESALVLT
ncbi:MAG: phospholipid carrier-dependent glycosyltransferase, partial [Blastochloris sp.]|nr:phospholipid carrier-dependent glycosyltransferase [Blastochloris sp.]